MIQADTHMPAPAPEKELKGWHVLLIMLAFFGVMFAVNGVFLYHAITSFPGEDVKKSYVQGLNYNDTLAARAAQAELGWQAEAGLQDDQIIFRLHDAEGQALSNFAVIGELRRSATRDHDQAVTFTSNFDGSYATDRLDLQQGQWHVRITVLDDAAENVLFKVDKTLLVK